MNMIKLLSNVILLKSVNHVYIKCWSVLRKKNGERACVKNEKFNMCKK